MKRLIDNADVLPAAEPARIAVPDLGSLDRIEFPVVTQALTKPPVRDEVLDASDGLDNLTMKALKKAEEILDMDLEPGSDDFSTILKAQVSQVQAILTTQARVDEGRFKKKQADKLGELLELIRGEEARQIEGRVLN